MRWRAKLNIYWIWPSSTLIWSDLLRLLKIKIISILVTGTQEGRMSPVALATAPMMQAGTALRRHPKDAVKESILAWDGDLHDSTLWKYTCEITEGEIPVHLVLPPTIICFQVTRRPDATPHLLVFLLFGCSVDGYHDELFNLKCFALESGNPTPPRNATLRKLNIKPLAF